MGPRRKFFRDDLTLRE